MNPGRFTLSSMMYNHLHVHSLGSLKETEADAILFLFNLAIDCGIDQVTYDSTMDMLIDVDRICFKYSELLLIRFQSLKTD